MKRNSIKKRIKNINKGVEAGVEADKREKNLDIAKKRKEKNIVQEEIKDPKKKIVTQEKKRKRNIYVNLKMKIHKKKTVKKKEKGIDQIVDVVIQVKSYLLVIHSHAKKTLPTNDSQNN